MSSESDLFEEQEHSLNQPSQISRGNNFIPLNTFRQKVVTLFVLSVLIIFFWYLNQEEKSFHPRVGSEFLFNANPTPIQTKTNFELISAQIGQKKESNKQNSQEELESQLKPKDKLQKLKQEIYKLQKELNQQIPQKSSNIVNSNNKKIRQISQGKSNQVQVKQSINMLNPIADQTSYKRSIASIPEEEIKIAKLNQTEFNSKIYAGQIHFSRIPVQYWQHRILMIKSMGLNTLSVYVMWNYHQIEQYKFDYQTENKNITRFLELAKKHSMKVLLRPGPYICGEWDFGGMPARLLGIKDLKIRSFDQLFLNQVNTFFKSLAPLIKPYLLTNGGPIHLIQIQNQLGSLKRDIDYTLALVKMWEQLQIKSQFYIQDSSPFVEFNYWKGAAIGLSGGNHESDFQLIKLSKSIDENALVFGGEIYSGWMTHWGERRWGGTTFAKFKQQMSFLITTKKQFSLYMAYGGTNFGLTAGANAGIHNLDYEPMITSYDYDAVITEQGKTTEKFDLMLTLMSKYIRDPSIDVPDPIKTIQIATFTPQLVGSLLQHKGEPFLRATKQLYFFQHQKIQMYNQGMVIYETFLNQSMYLFTAQIHDFAIVMLDGEFIANFSRIVTSTFEFGISCSKKSCQLLIIVEAMGHNNYGRNQEEDKKGMLSCFTMNSSQQFRWNLYRRPINENILTMDKISKKQTKFPAIFKATLNLKQIGDTYLDMSNYKKGYVWVNGRNLGRYWERGPQLRLYCPGVWLKKQDNQIVILQLLSHTPSEMNGTHLLVDAVKIKQEETLLKMDKLFADQIDLPVKIEVEKQLDQKIVADGLQIVGNDS